MAAESGAALSGSRRNGVLCFAAAESSDWRQRVGKASAAHLRFKGIIAQHPPNTRGCPRHVNGKRLSSSWQPNKGSEASSEAARRRNPAEVL
jgi:hypothetical protein